MKEQEAISHKDRETAFPSDEARTKPREDSAGQEVDQASRYWAQLKHIAA